MNKKINIIWCKKNLRTHDNEILAKLNSEVPTLGVYFFEPKIMSLPDYSDFHLQFTFESLLDLQKSFLTLWIPLLMLPYNAQEWLEKIQNYFDIDTLFSHEETWNRATYKRDKIILSYCKKSVIKYKEYPTNGIVRRLQNRDTWGKIWWERMWKNIFVAQSINNTIELPRELCNISKKTKEHYIHQLQVHRNNNLQKWWESEWITILKNFLKDSSRNYMYNISKPFESQKWCSRLSPYITYGCLSIKTIIQVTEAKRQELKEIWTPEAKSHQKSLAAFSSRLHWQSHFIQKLEDEPRIEYCNLNKDFDSIRTEVDTSLINKVFMSESWVPYIDSIIRQLQQTGWCNFRSRAILVSFLCNTCMQPWQAIAPRVAALFLDYEPGIHYSQFQMQAATTGINTVRIYNPVYNGQQKDPEWKFIYTYMPEFKKVPKKYIHEPHLWEWFKSLNYPYPIVDIKSANKIAKDLLWTTKGNILKSEKDKIVKKHASRVFQWDRRKKKVKIISNQIALF
jgi:deoxyribodipyrimidine photo-lyase